jgi:hypothetical protein
MKVIIIGGVAGGASCAARLRRLDENAEIIMVERGPYVSYANCGLPYHIGGVIPEESKLLVATVDTFRNQFNIDARVLCEAVAIAPDQKTVISRTWRPARSLLNPTTSWFCRPARRPSGRRFLESICPASFRSEQCPTPGKSENGWNRERPS